MNKERRPKPPLPLHLVGALSSYGRAIAVYPVLTSVLVLAAHMNTSIAFGLSAEDGQETRVHRAYSAETAPRFRFGVTEIARLLTSVPKLTTASPVGPGVTVTPPDCPTIDEIEARSVSTQSAFAEPESLPALTAPLAILP